MKTYTREDIYDLLVMINDTAESYSPHYGLPVNTSVKMEEYADLVITKLGLTIMEDERILTIQKYTGCTRAQAQSLIDSGEF